MPEMQIPQALYWLVGVLVVSNLGAIVSLLTFIFKAGRFVQKTEDGIEDAKQTGIRSHLRIDSLESLITTKPK